MLAAFIFISVFFTVAYAALLLIYVHGWRSMPAWQVPDDWEPSTKVSVIIPARNEVANIAACLRSIVAGTYPAYLLEVIVIDDFSDDGTAALVIQFSESLKLSEGRWPVIHLFSLAGCIRPGEIVLSHKKRAIEAGISCAGGELIVTTDADCVVPEDWLRLVASAFDASPAIKLLAAPVAFHRERNLLQRFQSLDFLGLMGITGAGIQLGWQRMGNGANLAYPKAVFEAAGGFAGNENRASGDDMFLIQKVATRWPGSIFFLKNTHATVLTEAKPDWRSFWQQRLRWGAKNAALPEWPVRLSLLTVFLFCWCILINGVLSILAAVGILNHHLLPVLFLFQVTVKALADYLFLREMCRFFNRTDLMRWFAPSFLLHTLYIPLAGTASLFFKKYEWKGRRVS